ncbi:Undefined function [Listeria monocytogenes N53-1]|nr:Undefined function [Listeria monocytogenes N53-1]
MGKKLSLYFVRHGQTYLNKNLQPIQATYTVQSQQP